MKKQLTIREVEQQIDQCERLLSVPQSMATWSKIVNIYNALKIKYCQMKGESPIVTYGQTDHII
ncbi:hypothetical protein FACS1894169_09210 [Bacteroidia bacterium]|nr:hypothetical protein FACS1894169_09210 [Bacteroidia bacterium]